MKPIHLNLAARPYRDYRPVYAVVVLASLLTAFLMLNNIETYYRYIHETRSTRAKIGNIEAQTRQERSREAQVQERLRGVDLARLDAQARFVNTRLEQRAFSWSTLLDELESVLADDVRLISINPVFKEDGGVDLSLQFEAKSGDGMITTMNRMNNDPQFRNPFPGTESVGADGTYTFNLGVEYIPRDPRTRTGTIQPAASAVIR